MSEPLYAPIIAGKPEEYKKLEAMINKRFGAGTIMRLGDPDAAKRFKIEVIPTQSMRLNKLTGKGGLPKGRITVIFGGEHSGKTGLALGVVAEAQKLGGKCAWVDPEYALDPDFATLVGVNLDDLYYVQPKHGEEAMDVCEALVASGLFSVVVLDSLAALVPKAELEGTMEDQQVGAQARLIGKALRKISGAIGRTKTVFIAINQMRDTMSLHGPKETMPGGRAPKFWSSLMIEVRRTEFIKDGDDIIGHRIRLRTVKNRLAPPQRSTEISIIYGKGIDQVAELIDLCIEDGILQRAGGWYSLIGTDGKVMEKDGKPLKWQGKEPIIEEARQNPKFFEYLKNRFEQKLRADSEGYEEMPEDELPPTDEELTADADIQAELEASLTP